MKRLFLIILMSLMWVYSAGAADWMVPSETKTASAVILASPGYFHGITVITDGTNTVTVDIYDNFTAAAVGSKLIPTWYVPSSATNRAQTYNLYPPVRAAKASMW